MTPAKLSHLDTDKYRQTTRERAIAAAGLTIFQRRRIIKNE
jgi:hypothetical protein